MPQVNEFNLAVPALFCEEFNPHKSSLFDAELDETVKAAGLAKQLIGGFCNIAAGPTEFRITDPNFRENVIAASSCSTSRQRAMVCGLSVALFGHGWATLPQITGYINRRKLKLYTAEANSPIFNGLKQGLRADLFFYSEYFGDEFRSGELVEGVMHQDLQATSFADDFFDLVITSDVLEHVPDALKAEKEIVRILKPGGRYVFTVPFVPYAEHDLVMARLDRQGEIEYLAEPQYHGDPLRPEGSLVYRLFSYNDLNERFENLGCALTHYRFWSKTLGLLDNNIFAHVVRKPAPDAEDAERSLLEMVSPLKAAKDYQGLLNEPDRPQDGARTEAYLRGQLQQQAHFIQSLTAEKDRLLVQLGGLQAWARELERAVLNRPFSGVAGRLKKFFRLK